MCLFRILVEAERGAAEQGVWEPTRESVGSALPVCSPGRGLESSAHYRRGNGSTRRLTDLSKILQQSWDVFSPRKYAFSMVCLITEGRLLAHSSHVYETPRLTGLENKVLSPGRQDEAAFGALCVPWGTWGLYRPHTSLSLLNQSPPLGGRRGRDFYLGKYPWWF